MTALESQDMQRVGDAYEARFGGLDEITHPAVICDLCFIQMLRNALESGQPVTREAVEREFPNVSWDW
jgi:hypothetical protein